MNPIKVADYSTEKGYIDEHGDTNWTLMTDGAAGLGLSSEALTVAEDDMKSALESGKVIICSMAPGDFTRSGSYIVIKDYKDGLFYVNDPTSQARSDVGWDFKRLSNQITNMWALSVGTGDTTTGSTESGDSTGGDNASTEGSGNNATTAESTTATTSASTETAN